MLGAAIRYASATPELVAAVYDSGRLSLYVRPFLPSYANDAAYDAATNPAGWRIIHSSPQALPRTPMFFNGSGTEGQAILPENRAKVALSQSSAAITLIPARGQGELTQTSVNVGAREVRDLCPIRSEIAETLTQNTVWTVPTVVCADYRGDEELLCRVDSETNADSQLTAYQTYDYRGSGLKTAGGTKQDVTSTRRVLRMGEIAVPLSGTVSKEDGQRSWRRERTATVPAINETTRYETDDYQTLISYLDLRNGVVAYVDSNRENVRRVAYTAIAVSNNAYVRAGTSQISESLTEKVVARLDGVTRTVADAPATSVTHEPTVVTGSYDPLQEHGCSSFLSVTPGERTSVMTWPVTDNFNIDASLHPNALAGTGQGFARSLAGDAASQVVTFPRSSAAGRTWAHLNNGQLSALIPGAPADARYFPIAVIR